MCVCVGVYDVWVYRLGDILTHDFEYARLCLRVWKLKVSKNMNLLSQKKSQIADMNHAAWLLHECLGSELKGIVDGAANTLPSLY